MSNTGNNNILLLLAIAAIVYILMNMNCKEEYNNQYAEEEFFDPKVDISSSKIPLVQKPPQLDKPRTVTIPEVNDAIFKPLPEERTQGPALPSNFTLGVNINDPTNNKFSAQAPRNQPRLTSKDLLPAKSDQKWFDTPEVGIKIEDANLLADAINKVGIDTVGQTRKNPSYDLRGSIPCPKFIVSPWNNSTIEYDTNIKSLY